MQSTELYYRKSAAQGANGFGVLIALYDTLAGDLRRAAAAERSSNLEQRCVEVNHAFVVIGYLEDWIERAGGGELAEQLTSLYSSLRRKLLEAQAKRSPDILEQQMEQILHLRESWQKLETAVPDTLAAVMTATGHGDPHACQPIHSTSWAA